MSAPAEGCFSPDMLPDFMPRKVTVDADGCWLWQGAKTKAGYGLKHIRRPDGGSQSTTAHRAAWLALVGPIPEGLQVDHLCRVRACVNPAHLEPVTPRENLLRADGLLASQLARTHCPHGHPYDEENTYPSYKRGGKPHRVCKTCRRKQMRRINAAKRARQ